MIAPLLILQVLTFVGLLLVLRMMFYRQLQSAVQRLQRLHEENLLREEELKRQLEEAKRQREEELSKAKAEAARLLKEARQRSDRLSAEIQGQAAAQAQQIVDQGRLELKKLERELLQTAQERSLSLSLRLLKLTFTRSGRQALQHELLSELMEELHHMDGANFAVKTGQAQVTSAVPMTEEEKRKLRQILSEKVKAALELEEVVDEELIAGLVIRMGGVTIDGSLRNKLHKAIPLVQEAQ